MKDIPDQDTFWGTVLEEAPEPYIERISNSTPYNGLGDYGILLYLSSKELKAKDMLEDDLFHHEEDLRNIPHYIDELKTGYRAAGTVGASFRIVDDILDGHGVAPLESIEKRKELQRDYMHSLKTGEVETDLDHELAVPACISASLIHEILRDTPAEESFYQRLKDIGDMMVKEDKSEPESYRRSRKFDAGEYTRILVDTLHILPTFNVDEEFYHDAHDLGVAYGVSDDLWDGEDDLPSDEVEKLHYDAFESLKKSDSLFFRTAAYLGQFPEVYKFIHKIGQKQKSLL